MDHAYVVTGTLTDARTVALDEALPIAATKVRVVVEPLASAAQRPYLEVVSDIRERQRTRGHRPRTREAVDAILRAERGS
jgi:hypothetical protein